MMARPGLGEQVAQPDVDDIDLATVLQALSDPVRLEMVRQLDRCGPAGEMTCGQLELPVSKSTGSHHLRILREAGIVAERGQGTRKYLHLRRDDLAGRFPGLLESVLRAAAVDSAPSPSA